MAWECGSTLIQRRKATHYAETDEHNALENEILHDKAHLVRTCDTCWNAAEEKWKLHTGKRAETQKKWAVKSVGSNTHLADDQKKRSDHSNNSGRNRAVSRKAYSDRACEHANNGDKSNHSRAGFDFAFFDLVPDPSTETGATARL